MLWKLDGYLNMGEAVTMSTTPKSSPGTPAQLLLCLLVWHISRRLCTWSRVSYFLSWASHCLSVQSTVKRRRTGAARRPASAPTPLPATAGHRSWCFYMSASVSESSYIKTLYMAGITALWAVVIMLFILNRSYRRYSQSLWEWLQSNECLNIVNETVNLTIDLSKTPKTIEECLNQAWEERKLFLLLFSWLTELKKTSRPLTKGGITSMCQHAWLRDYFNVDHFL